jgi:hypothetical protein
MYNFSIGNTFEWLFEFLKNVNTRKSLYDFLYQHSSYFIITFVNLYGTIGLMLIRYFIKYFNAYIIIYFFCISYCLIDRNSGLVMPSYRYL